MTVCEFCCAVLSQGIPNRLTYDRRRPSLPEEPGMGREPVSGKKWRSVPLHQPTAAAIILRGIGQWAEFRPEQTRALRLATKRKEARDEDARRRPEGREDLIALEFRAESFGTKPSEPKSSVRCSSGAAEGDREAGGNPEPGGHRPTP